MIKVKRGEEKEVCSVLPFSFLAGKFIIFRCENDNNDNKGRRRRRRIFLQIIK